MAAQLEELHVVLLVSPTLKGLALLAEQILLSLTNLQYTWNENKAFILKIYV